jgi:hypothetical protein
MLRAIASTWVWRDRIRLGLRLVADPRLVAAQHQHVADTECNRPQQIRLEREPVAVAAGDLQDRLDAALQEEVRRDQAGQVRLRPRAIGHVHRRRDVTQRQRARDEFGQIG